MEIPARYTAPAIALHWAIAVLMIANVALIYTLPLFGDWAERPFIDTHKSIGLTVLGLAALRLLWRATHPAPALPSYPRAERRAAHAAHAALYVLIFALPLSGWMHDSAWRGAPGHPLTLFHVVPWFRLGFLAHLPDAAKDHWHALLYTVHRSLAYALYALLALHVAGALKHEWQGHRELARMLPGR